jgi:hypothetical protein
MSVRRPLEATITLPDMPEAGGPLRRPRARQETSTAQTCRPMTCVPDQSSPTRGRSDNASTAADGMDAANSRSAPSQLPVASRISAIKSGPITQPNPHALSIKP